MSNPELTHDSDGAKDIIIEAEAFESNASESLEEIDALSSAFLQSIRDDIGLSYLAEQAAKMGVEYKILSHEKPGEKPVTFVQELVLREVQVLGAVTQRFNTDGTCRLHFVRNKLSRQTESILSEMRELEKMISSAF